MISIDRANKYRHRGKYRAPRSISALPQSAQVTLLTSQKVLVSGAITD